LVAFGSFEAFYSVSFALELVAAFFTTSTAYDRGSDAERLAPSVRVTPERPEAKDRGSDVGQHVAGRTWTP